LVAVSKTEISIDSRFGHENAMQASIVESKSLQNETNQINNINNTIQILEHINNAIQIIFLT